MELKVFLLLPLIAICVYVWIKLKIKHIATVTKNIPGPTTLPWKALIENLITNKSKASNYKLYNTVEKMVAPYPDLCKGWVGPICLIDVRNPVYVKKVLTSPECIDRAVFYSFPYKTGLLISGGDIWKRHRKILNPAFSSSKLNKFMPIVNEKARKLTKVLKDLVGQEPFNVARLLSAVTLESLLRTSFGIERDFVNNPYERFFEIVKKEASDIGNTMANVFTAFFPRVYRQNDFTRYCDSILKQAEEEVRQSGEFESRNFLEILMKQKNVLSEEEVNDEVCTIILAGNASTALTMSTVLLMLGMHKDVQDKVIEEFKSVFYNFDDEIGSENINQLKYLDMVIKETMRLFPLAPVIGRSVTDDLKLDDLYTLPKGSNAVIRINDIHRNPQWWGEDAGEFKPERFLPENIEKIHPFAYIPFSVGSRNCIGYKYAQNAMKIVLSHILRKFEVTTPLKYAELQLEISFILRISQRYMIQIRPRK